MFQQHKSQNQHLAAQRSANSEGSEQRLRVAMIVAGFPQPESPDRGIFNFRAAKGLRELVDLTVIHLRTWRPGRPAIHMSNYQKIPVITISAIQVPTASWTFNVALYRLFGWRRVCSLLEKFDLIHSVEGAFVGVIASSWSRRARIKHVTQLIGGDVSVLPKLMGSRVLAGWEQNVQGVACNSQRLAKEFLALYPKVQNVRTLYRGVDLSYYHPSGSGAGPFSLRPPVRFFYVGGFASYTNWPYGDNTKGGRTLLAAWQQGEEDLVRSGASLLIAGPRANSDDIVAWRSSLRKPEHVYIAGHLHPEVIPQYMRSSDVVLIPSMAEGLPNVAMEAAACGRPVFGSSVGGIPEVIEDGETGLILPPGDVTSWKNALVSYANQPNELRSLGKRARQRMELMFDCSGYAKHLVDLYYTALGETG
jgi:glycosyltransferase involved in cell wall biosynthesis